MKINLICFGKIKDNNLKNCIDTFIKRIKHFTNFDIIELNEEKIDDESNLSLIEIALEKEFHKIQKYLLNSCNILLDVNGNEFDSIQFANFLDKKMTNNKQINFFIGSSFGFAKSFKNQNHYKISFSKLTFNHQIFRLMFLEQIYRAFCINNNIKYHK